MIATPSLDVRRCRHFGKKTETAATVINIFIPPEEGLFTRLSQVIYTVQGTAHTLTFLRPLGRTTLSANAAASQAVMVLTEQPATNFGLSNDVAQNDYLVWKNTDGTYSFGVVTSVSGLTITMTASLAKAAAAGNPVWMLGVVADTNTDGYAHPDHPAAASATLSLTTDSEFGVVSTLRPFEPMIVQSDNATAAGTFRRVCAVYTSR